MSAREPVTDALHAATLFGTAAGAFAAGLIAVVPEASSGVWQGVWPVATVTAGVGLAVGARLGREARATGGRLGRGALAGVAVTALAAAAVGVIVHIVALVRGEALPDVLESVPVTAMVVGLGTLLASPLGALAGAAFYPLRTRAQSAPPNR